MRRPATLFSAFPQWHSLHLLRAPCLTARENNPCHICMDQIRTAAHHCPDGAGAAAGAGLPGELRCTLPKQSAKVSL